MKANKLKQVREEQGLTQEELAKLLKVDQRTVSKWELGKSVPSVAIMQLLEDYSGVKKEAIFFEAFNYKKLLKIDIKQQNGVKLNPKEAAK